jgi:hypothetical protein
VEVLVVITQPPLQLAGLVVEETLFLVPRLALLGKVLQEVAVVAYGRLAVVVALGL